MDAELTRKLLMRVPILGQDYYSRMTQISTALCLRQILPVLHRPKNRRFVAQLLTELYGFFISKVEQGGTRTAKGGTEKRRSKRERRFAVASYKNQNKTNMARRFSAAWQRANHFDDARHSRFSTSVAIAPRHPVTSLTPDSCT